MQKSNGFLKGALWGAVIGMVNGLFGAGGGLLAVPVLKKMGLEGAKAHANAVAVILPVSVVSATLYLAKGYVGFSDAFQFVPTGLLGAVVGTYILKKISPLWLKRIFGGFMVYAGVRLLLR